MRPGFEMRIPATVTWSPSGITSGGPAMVRALAVRGSLAAARGGGGALARRRIALLHRGEALLQQLGEIDHLGLARGALASRRLLHVARRLLLDELHQVL